MRCMPGGENRTNGWACNQPMRFFLSNSLSFPCLTKATNSFCPLLHKTRRYSFSFSISRRTTLHFYTHTQRTLCTTMAASVQAAATLMQPSKLAVSARTASSQLRSSQTVSKAFGLESAGARLTCSLNADLKDVARKFSDAAKIAGFALATSALVVSVCHFFCSWRFCLLWFSMISICVLLWNLGSFRSRVRQFACCWCSRLYWLISFSCCLLEVRFYLAQYWHSLRKLSETYSQW